MPPMRCDCGATLDVSADWCSQCYRRPGDPAPATASGRPIPDVPASSRQSAPIPVRPTSTGTGRWAPSAVTFGLRGRLIATVLGTLPLILFLVTWSVTGVIIYGGLYVWALRDIWKRSDRR